MLLLLLMLAMMAAAMAREAIIRAMPSTIQPAKCGAAAAIAGVAAMGRAVGRAVV